MFEIMFIIVPILIGVIFIFTFAMILSPKLRGKLMSRQFKAVKYIMDESKNDLTDIMTTAGNVAVNSSKSILDQNEDTLKDMSTRTANIGKEGIEITTRAIKNGLTKGSMFCKHCGQSIDKDSKYCQYCGKEQ